MSLHQLRKSSNHQEKNTEIGIGRPLSELKLVSKLTMMERQTKLLFGIHFTTHFHTNAQYTILFSKATEKTSSGRSNSDYTHTHTLLTPTGNTILQYRHTHCHKCQNVEEESFNTSVNYSKSNLVPRTCPSRHQTNKSTGGLAPYNPYNTNTLTYTLAHIQKPTQSVSIGDT